MQINVIQNPSEWNEKLATIPYAHVLQSWEWGEIKARYGWVPTRVLFCENAAPVAAAQLLRRALPRTPFGVIYVPKGPALRFENSVLLNRVLESLENIARQQRAIFIKIDPDIGKNQPAASILGQRHWRASVEQIQFHNTVTLDLKPSEEDLLDRMKPKWRYNIRLAERKGVKIVEGNAQSLKVFYDMYAETGSRDNFLIRPFAYYEDVWKTMLGAHRAKIFLASKGEQVIAGLILFLFGARVWYFYGASRSAHRDFMPNHLLQWHAMRWSKAHGCTEYDFWGAPDVLDESALMYGVYKFKAGFGGEFVERIAAHDFVVNRALYWAYAVARPKYLARLKTRQSTLLTD